MTEREADPNTGNSGMFDSDSGSDSDPGPGSDDSITPRPAGFKRSATTSQSECRPTSAKKNRLEERPEAEVSTNIGNRDSHKQPNSTGSNASTSSICTGGHDSSVPDGEKLSVMQQISVQEALKEEVHHWKAYNMARNKERKHSTDIFDFLPFSREYLQFNDFVNMLKNVLCQAPYETNEHGACRRAELEHFYQKAKEVTRDINSRMSFSVPSAPDQCIEMNQKVRTYHMYPAMSRGVFDPGNVQLMEQLSVLTSSLQESKDQMQFHAQKSRPKEDPSQGLLKFLTFQKEESGYHAVRFLEESIQFLVQQESATKKRHEKLFAAFCAVAGLYFEDAACIPNRKMKILSQHVTSKPDLRATQPVLPRMEELSFWRKIWNRPRSVIAVAEVKSQESRRRHSTQQETNSPGDDTDTCGVGQIDEEGSIAEEQINDVLGQLTGEMIGEVLSGETLSKDWFLGFAVQCTKVQATLMKLPDAVKRFLKDTVDFPCEPFSGEGGNLYYTSSYDMFIREDRLKLWEIISVAAASGANMP